MLTLLQSLPIWLLAITMIAIGIGAAVAGVALANRLEHHERRHGYNDLVGFLIAVVGTIYAVLLAWVAVITWEAYNRAERVVVEEASSVGDVARLAMGLPPDRAATVRDAAFDYARSVVQQEWPAMRHRGAPSAAWGALDRIERAIVTFKPADGGEQNVHAEMLDRYARLIDARRERLHAAATGIETVVWLVLLLGAGTLLVMSCMFGTDAARHRLLTGFLATSIAIALLMVVAMDRPFAGSMRVPADAFEEVLARFDQRP